MAATDKYSSQGMALLGHVFLVVAIASDFFRRSAHGIWPIVLSTICLILLVIAGLIFVREPRLFFFISKNISSFRYDPSVTARLFVWALVVLFPLFWILVGIDLLPNLITSELLRRLVGSYMFFAYIAGAIIGSPYLFGRKD
jgi:hypothetical protein